MWRSWVKGVYQSESCDQPAYEEVKFEFAHGDRLVVYSDGSRKQRTLLGSRSRRNA
jgi:hypothetical protein